MNEWIFFVENVLVIFCQDINFMDISVNPKTQRSEVQNSK